MKEFLILEKEEVGGDFLKLLGDKAYLLGIKLCKDTGGQAKLWRGLISRKCV